LYYPTKREIEKIVRAFLRLAAAQRWHVCTNGGKGGGSKHRAVQPHGGKNGK